MRAVARFIMPLAAIAAVAVLPAQSAERQARPVSGFTGIGLAVPLKLELTQGDAESLALAGDAEALANVETAVENGILMIRSKKKFNWGPTPKIRAFVSAKNIESLRISGSGDISAPSLRVNALKLSISGSGDIRIGALAATSLDVSVTGSGDVSVAGKTDTFAARVSGSGNVKAGKLEARDAKVSIAGSGDMTLWARESLTVKVAGSGDVRYYGDPAVTKAIAGSGSVRRMGAAPS